MTIKEALLSAVSSARRSGGANGEELRASTESALLVAHSMPLPAMETSVKMPDDELSCSDVLPTREECPGALLSPMLAFHSYANLCDVKHATMEGAIHQLCNTSVCALLHSVGALTRMLIGGVAAVSE
jgi:hypothetical protein